MIKARDVNAEYGDVLKIYSTDEKLNLQILGFSNPDFIFGTFSDYNKLVLYGSKEEILLDTVTKENVIKILDKNLVDSIEKDIKADIYVMNKQDFSDYLDLFNWKRLYTNKKD